MKLIDSLNDIIQQGKVLVDADSLARYGADWTKVYEPAPEAIVLPRNIEELQALVLFANANGLALVPSGGRTGLSGGAVAAHGEIVVAFDLMNRVLSFDESDRCVRV